MTEHAPVRRRVPAKEELSPEASRLRRRYLWGGAILGVAIGALVAVFVIPPLMSHYFGTADVQFRDTYERDGHAVTVERLAAGPVHLPLP